MNDLFEVKVARINARVRLVGVVGWLLMGLLALWMVSPLILQATRLLLAWTTNATDPLGGVR
jgi:hypothetical protein